MFKKFIKYAKYVLITIVSLFLLLIVGLSLRLIYAPKLQPWHMYIPDELTAAELDKATWADFIAREDKMFSDIYREVVLKTPNTEKNQINRYFENSLVYPSHFERDWNRSYALIPSEPKGAVVFLHGLTDAPYSLRHIAQLYYQRDFVVIGLRVPGHGTVPGALTKITWKEWTGATRLAVREARRLNPKGTPLHLVGFSQGGTLALKHALDALENETLSYPDKLILISPMIGITRLSKLAEIMESASVIPGFEKAAWISIISEFNPFKFNSFPANAVKQARLLITEMKEQIIRLHKNGEMKSLPPVTAFQSIIDYTVSTPALINDLFSYLPDNNSELVLFDINRDTAFLPLVRPVFVNMLSKMLPDLPLPYKMTVIGNVESGDSHAVERTALPGNEDFLTRDLGLTYPSDVFSLSHISLPFPQSDALYGSAPNPEKKDEFGLNLGIISNAQGERGILEINTNLFFRISSNPLFPYLAERINEIIDDDSVLPKHLDRQYKANSKAKMTEKEYDLLMQELDYDEVSF